jgi:hypothetical protein
VAFLKSLHQQRAAAKVGWIETDRVEGLCHYAIRYDEETDEEEECFHGSWNCVFRNQK